MPSTRADELEELGLVWDTADTQFAENLAAARAYYTEAGTLAAPRHATALDKPVGQWLTNLRRPGGLGKEPERAARRGEQLVAINRTETRGRWGGPSTGNATPWVWPPCWRPAVRWRARFILMLSPLHPRAHLPGTQTSRRIVKACGALWPGGDTVEAF
ncbi:helicase associated domain-containing protein [Streptomyces sp. NPDC057486]|uniref:helicase associated domain-containing protein n=1 Tax=Streptomyces sp. NPDC057486 TaxID=3346145 RepID=UPI003686886B